MNRISTAARIRPGWLSIAAYTGMFTFGIVMALLGAILPLISQRLHFGLAQAGNLFFALNLAMLITTLALGPLLDRFGMAPSPPRSAGCAACAASASCNKRCGRPRTDPGRCHPAEEG